MPSWRAACLLVAASLLLAGCAGTPTTGDGTTDDGGRDDPGIAEPASYVDPFIGTGAGAPGYEMNNAAGDTFPGAVVPFGMVQFSPIETRAAGGYRYDQRTIYGFSPRNFSGRGAKCLADLPIFPIAGGPGRTPWDPAARRASFSHATERAEPGLYSVDLNGGAMSVDLTATTHTGLMRVRSRDSEALALLFDAGGGTNGAFAGTLTTVDAAARRVEGVVESGNCGSLSHFRYRLFFTIDIDRPIVYHGAWDRLGLHPGAASARGPRSGAYVTLDVPRGETAELRVGLSFVSLEGARANLEAERAYFDDAAAAARRRWNAHLSRVLVADGKRNDKVVFYTALYHALIHPNVFSDVDGRYLGFDGAVHRARGHHYENLSGWDNSRAQFQLLSVLFPEVASDMAQTLVDDAAQDPGGGLPRWEQASTNSGEMVGAGQDVDLANAWAYGARAFDARAALAAMRRGAELPGARSAGHPVREGLESYLRYGYVPAPQENSGALTLEYAQADFAIARLAAALGDEALAARYRERARSWRSLVHDGRLATRDVLGRFVGDDPASREGWVEGDAAQYEWMVPHDARGLIGAIGGDQAAIAQLDAHFRHLNAGPRSQYAFLGNEPELGAPFLYAWTSAPWKGQGVVRRALLELYHASPGGMPGNDDGGSLSAWVVFAMLGLYPAVPGQAGFVVGTPMFPDARLTLGTGAALHVRAEGAARDAAYVRSLAVNGAPYDKSWIPWELVAEGADLDLAVSAVPHLNWAAGEEARPPSLEAR
jgi:predicted alpha-1,2-mannosidase